MYQGGGRVSGWLFSGLVLGILIGHGHDLRSEARAWEVLSARAMTRALAGAHDGTAQCSCASRFGTQWVRLRVYSQPIRRAQWPGEPPACGRPVQQHRRLARSGPVRRVWLLGVMAPTREGASLSAKIEQLQTMSPGGAGLIERLVDDILADVGRRL